MKNLAQVLPQFTKIQILSDENAELNFQSNCAYLLNENSSINKFIEKIGKKYERANELLNLYDFYTAYNITFPTIPATVSLMNQKRLVAMGIRNFEELLEKILENSTENLPLAVFLSVQARTPEEMLKIKREILQQFIFLRMYLPIIVEENFRAAVKIFNAILNSPPNTKTDITFIGTKKSGKSSLINAVLGEEYSPSSSELPTPNKVSYEWSGEFGNLISIVSAGNKKVFSSVSGVNQFLTQNFQLANKNAIALKPMQIFLSKFPEDIRQFRIIDTPGPNFAASKEHTQVTENTLQDIQHCIFVMNYSAHLTNDEVELFDKVYNVLNNSRRHQTIIVAVNRIDEMYAAEVIKSYERFADYVKGKLNALGYENIVVVSISAITAVYVEKIRQLIQPENNLSLEKQLKNLRRQYKGTNQATVISFVEKYLETLSDFQGVEIENLEQLKKTSRVNYLVEVFKSMYDPAEQFEWIDETFEDNVNKNQGEDFIHNLKYAKMGDPVAMNNVAYQYRYGVGVNQDMAEAIDWYNKAADAKNDIAMFELAKLYRTGEILSKNEKRALLLCRKSAEIGNVDAMVLLAEMCFNGEGTYKNFYDAFYWNFKAAKLGNSVAMTNLAFQYQMGVGVKKNFSEAVLWYEKAIECGNVEAISLLAKLYYSIKNFTEAFKYFRIAAKNGNADCMNYLGIMYEFGEGVSENYNQAVEWYIRAMQAGNIQSIYNLGKCYYNGNGVEKNDKRAYELFYKAAKKGLTDAMIALDKALNEGNEEAQEYIDKLKSEDSFNLPKSDGFITSYLSKFWKS